MNDYVGLIRRIEAVGRVAVTKKYPVLLPVVLESKRAIRTFVYTFSPKFRSKIANSTKYFNLVEHSSPLYRKYNKRELDNGKVENIKIAIQSLDGIIIPPGKTFSFWKHVGRPSLSRGFKNGLVLSAGLLKEDVGGGLCQLSNLLAYMFACTECVFEERKHHSKDVFPDSNRMIPFASGATVYFNLIDLKVRNTYSVPIKINLRVTDTQLRGSVSIPMSLPYFIKLEEKDSRFIRSSKTHHVYRCNTLQRVFYSKGTKTKIKVEPLWVNVAEVMYNEAHLAHTVVRDSDNQYI